MLICDVYIHSYSELTAQITKDVPVFALDDGCVMSGAEFSFESIEEVASLCIEKVLALCKSFAIERRSTFSEKEPIEIILGGWSYGGVVASAMASHLANLSPRPICIKALILFDPPLRARTTFSGDQIAPVRHNAEPISDSDLKREDGGIESPDKIAEDRAEYHFSKCTALLRKFHRRPVIKSLIECPLLYIFPKESEYTCGADTASEVTNGAVSSLESPGTHWTMLFGANASVVAGFIVSFLKAN